MSLFRFLPCIYYIFQSKVQRVIFMRRLLYDSLRTGALADRCHDLSTYNDLEVQRNKVEHQQIRDT